MNTSEFEPSNPAQSDFTASLPDVEQLTKLANELFSALPCDGSRLGIAASSVPGGLTASLAGLDAGAPAQDFGLPGEAGLRQLFAPRKGSRKH
jgi:cysteine desulfurase/selenocysteine lyase